MICDCDRCTFFLLFSFRCQSLFRRALWILDLIAFQELHSLEEDFVHNFEKEVKGTGFFYINSTERFSGTGILIRNNLQNLKNEHI